MDHERLRRCRIACAVGSAVALALVLASCSSIPPVENDRKGLLQALEASQGGHVSHHLAGILGRDPAESERSSRAASTMGKLQWPLEDVHVTSYFGRRTGEFHEGIDLRARPGTPVYAAYPGVVIYADSSIRGYGKMIVIRHRSGLATVYAHASRALVRRGERVLAGQEIALSGSTGKTRGPHLHFEVRRGVEAIDPLKVLPNPLFSHLPKTKREDRVAEWP